MTARELEALYLKAVESIAANDDPAELRSSVVEQTITVGLVADLFGRTPRQVARAVLRLRRAAVSA